MDNQVILPGLRTARAREKFMAAADAGMSPTDLFHLAVESIEEGASRWGNACPECRSLAEWDGRGFRCPEGHDLRKGTSLLIAWEPVL